MPESIYKLQPNRTIQLRGFDHLGAGAAVHSATANSFKVSGVFRDTADFAVLFLYDADNFYEHPRLKYLPDFDFDGLTLQFDVRYNGLMPLDCNNVSACAMSASLQIIMHSPSALPSATTSMPIRKSASMDTIGLSAPIPTPGRKAQS